MHSARWPVEGLLVDADYVRGEGWVKTLTLLPPAASDAAADGGA